MNDMVAAPLCEAGSSSGIEAPATISEAERRPCNEDERRRSCPTCTILSEVLNAKLQQLITLTDQQDGSPLQGSATWRRNSGSAPSPFSSGRNKEPEHRKKLQESIDGLPEGLARSSSGGRGWRAGGGAAADAGGREKVASEEEVRRICALKNEECERLSRRLRALTDEMNARNDQVVQLMARLEAAAKNEVQLQEEVRSFRSHWEREVDDRGDRQQPPSPVPEDRSASGSPRTRTPEPAAEARPPEPPPAERREEEPVAEEGRESGEIVGEPAEPPPSDARSDAEAAADAAAAAVRRFFELGERRKYDSRGRRVGPLDAACSKKTLLRELKEAREANGRLQAELRESREKITKLEAFIAAGPLREPAPPPALPPPERKVPAAERKAAAGPQPQRKGRFSWALQFGGRSAPPSSVES